MFKIPHNHKQPNNFSYKCDTGSGITPLLFISVKTSSEIYPFLLDHQRTVHDLGINGTNIFADDAKKE